MRPIAGVIIKYKRYNYFIIPTHVELAKVADNQGELPKVICDPCVDMCLKLASNASKSTPCYLIL